jgi:hypothetical protein
MSRVEEIQIDSSRQVISAPERRVTDALPCGSDLTRLGIYLIGTRTVSKFTSAFRK